MERVIYNPKGLIDMYSGLSSSKSRNLGSEQFAAMSRLFSSTVIREMARKGESPLFARLALETNLLDSVSNRSPVYRFFDKAFSMLKQEGVRDEYIYKAVLMRRILLGKYSLRSACMLNEFRVGECKADIVILNGTATVYEVKSERDSLQRLRRQLSAYLTVFAEVYVIAAEDHILGVESLVPEDVGILCLSANNRILTVREAINRPARTSPGAIFESLRTHEAKQLLLSLGVTVPDLPNTVLRSTLKHLFLKLDPSEAHQGMVKVLKETRNLVALSALVTQLPKSLRAAALSVPLRKADHARLIEAVQTKMEVAMNWA
jgi:hypothetical protein